MKSAELDEAFEHLAAGASVFSAPDAVRSESSLPVRRRRLRERIFQIGVVVAGMEEAAELIRSHVEAQSRRQPWAMAPKARAVLDSLRVFTAFIEDTRRVLAAQLPGEIDMFEPLAARFGRAYDEVIALDAFLRESDRELCTRGATFVLNAPLDLKVTYAEGPAFWSIEQPALGLSAIGDTFAEAWRDFRLLFAQAWEQRSAHVVALVASLRGTLGAPPKLGEDESQDDLPVARSVRAEVRAGHFVTR